MPEVFMRHLLFAILLIAGTAHAGSATLNWTPPTQNTDGSTLTDLAGYRIVYGSSATALSQQIQVGNPGIVSYVMEGLSEGTQYFAVLAYNAAGTSSGPSNVVSKTIASEPPLVLSTVGGDVFIASPNYTIFGWKTGARAGSIKAGVKCDRTRRIMATDFYRVPNASVTWAGTAKSDYVVAACKPQ